MSLSTNSSYWWKKMRRWKCKRNSKPRPPQDGLGPQSEWETGSISISTASDSKICPHGAHRKRQVVSACGMATFYPGGPFFFFFFFSNLHVNTNLNNWNHQVSLGTEQFILPIALCLRHITLSLIVHCWSPLF
jgi:hypothetical protein